MSAIFFDSRCHTHTAFVYNAHYFNPVILRRLFSIKNWPISSDHLSECQIIDFHNKNFCRCQVVWQIRILWINIFLFPLSMLVIRLFIQLTSTFMKAAMYEKLIFDCTVLCIFWRRLFSTTRLQKLYK